MKFLPFGHNQLAGNSKYFTFEQLANILNKPSNPRPKAREACGTFLEAQIIQKDIGCFEVNLTSTRAKFL